MTINDKDFTIQQDCIYQYSSGVLMWQKCNYNVNYLEFRDFVFNCIILTIVWVYLFFKFVRYFLDLYFKDSLWKK